MQYCATFSTETLKINLPLSLLLSCCCRSVCVLLWVCGGGGESPRRFSETLARPQRGDLDPRRNARRAGTAVGRKSNTFYEFLKKKI